VNDSQNHKFEDTIVRLFEKASEDGIISDEEGALIMSIKLDLEEYVQAVNKAEEDGVITVEEALKLGELKNRMVVNAGIIAAKDYHISQDEKSLILKLVEILKSDL
jgi:hypothetical protein